MLTRLKKGTLRKGEVLTMKSTGKKYEIQELGIMHPEFVPVPALQAGQVTPPHTFALNPALHAGLVTPPHTCVSDSMI